MKSLVILALVGLLVSYVCGRAIIVQDDGMLNDDNHGCDEKESYESCAMCCEDVKLQCLDKAGDDMNARQNCLNEENECKTGESSNDEDLPAYKRVVKRSCQAFMDTNESEEKRNTITFDFIMQQ